MNDRAFAVDLAISWHRKRLSVPTVAYLHLLTFRRSTKKRLTRPHTAGCWPLLAIVDGFFSVLLPALTPRNKRSLIIRKIKRSLRILQQNETDIFPLRNVPIVICLVWFGSTTTCDRGPSPCLRQAHDARTLCSLEHDPSPIFFFSPVTVLEYLRAPTFSCTCVELWFWERVVLM